MPQKPIKRAYETRYWMDARESRPISKGFPKAEVGSIEGASRMIAKGFASKVQCIERESEKVLWTVKRGPKVRGVNIRPVEVIRGDDEGPGRGR